MVTGANPNPAGYSGTPLHRKLGVKPEARVLVADAPDDFDTALVAPRALGIDLRTTVEDGPFDVLLLFCPGADRMAALLPAGMAATARGGRCWVAWPKRASGVPTDLTEDVVRAAALAAGWVDVKVAAVDAIWSGLCLMRRTSGPSRSAG